MDPLPALRALATDVKDPEGHITNLEGGLGDAGCFYTRTEHVLLGREVLRRGQAIYAVKVVLCRVVELELGRAIEAALHRLVCPQLLDDLGDFWGEHKVLSLGRQPEDKLALFLKKKTTNTELRVKAQEGVGE